MGVCDTVGLAPVSDLVQATRDRSPSRAAAHFRHDIQGFRGVAVILVILYHSGFLSGGFVGVDVFFVISGFVITGTLKREWMANGTIRFRHFYKRRVRRLLPALSVVTACTVVASIFFQSPNGPQQETAKAAIGATATVANYSILRSLGGYFSPIAERNPLLHTWSLSVEEQFFLIFPAVLFAGWALERRRSIRNLIGNRWAAVWLVAGGLAVPSILISLSTSYEIVEIPFIDISPRDFAFYSSITRAWEFAVGALLVLLAEPLARIPAWLFDRLGSIGGVLVFGSAVYIGESVTFPGFAAVVPVFGAAALIVSGSAERPGGKTLLEDPLLVWIGDLSYSWYLWHWPVLVFTRLHISEQGWVMVAAAGGSLVPAYFSYRYVESPNLRAAVLQDRRVLGVLLLAVMIPGSLAALLAVGSRSGWGLDWPIGAHTVVSRGCDHGSFDPDDCTWTVDNPQGVVLLAGDSASWAVADGVIAGASQLGYDTTVGSLNGCPFVHPVGDSERGGTAECVIFQNAVLEYAVRTKPALAVVANWSFGYAGPGLERWETSLVGVFDSLSAVGIPVVILSQYPSGDEHAMERLLFSGTGTDRSTNAVSQRGGRAWLIELESELAERHDGVFLYDPYPVFCDEEFCQVAEGGVEYYTDPNHLSRAGSMELALSLEELFASVLDKGR